MNTCLKKIEPKEFKGGHTFPKAIARKYTVPVKWLSDHI